MSNTTKLIKLCDDIIDVSEILYIERLYIPSFGYGVDVKFKNGCNLVVAMDIEQLWNKIKEY